MNEETIYYKYQTPWKMHSTEPLYKFTKQSNGEYIRSCLLNDDWIYDGATLASTITRMLHEKVIKIIPESEVMLERL